MSESSSPIETPRHARRAIFAGAALLVMGLGIWRLDPALDSVLHVRLLAQPGPVASRLLIGLTDLGGGTAMIPLGLLACAIVLRRGARARAAWLFATVASGRILVELVKLACDRPRPPASDWLTRVDSLSMPSSHSAGSMLTLLAICAACDARARWWCAALAFALAIGSTRVLLGVHWPSDVLAGCGLGLLWVGAAMRRLPKRSR